ncbi:MAG: helix-turn-helix transcriptional regulator [Phycisphaerae bacterium]|nr:helix-turn-helix transcriptional regulator [Phycisphaerae bacterium]
MKIPHELKSQHCAILNTTSPLNNCFKPLFVGMDIVSDPQKYHYNGAFRDFDNPHTIFQYTLDGSGRISYQGIEYDLPCGYAFFCNSHDPDIVYYYPAENDKPWKLLFVTFDNMITLADEMLQRFGPIYKIPEQSESIKEIKLKLQQKTTHIDLNPAKGFRLATTIINSLLDSVFISSETDTHSNIINNALNYIIANIHQALSVEQIAEHLDISREHLARVFRKELDSSPLYFINITKMRHAGKLLRTTSLNIKEIANATGYHNTSQFARLFRRITNMSPTDFRNAQGRPIF